MHRTTVLLILLAVLVARPAVSGTIRVPEDYPSVLAGLDAAVSGDSVFVGPGTWTERETRTLVINGLPQTVRANGFLKAGVSIIGRLGAEATILAADDAPIGYQRILFLPDQAGSEWVLVEGLTLLGFGFPSGGLSGHYSSVMVVRSCVIIGHFKGIHMRECNLQMYDTVITECDASGTSALAAGIECLHANLLLDGCRFEGNIGSADIIETYDGTYLTIENCHFLGNHGRVALLRNHAVLLIRNNWFQDNESGVGGGCLQINDCQYNTIVNNIGPGPYGSAMVNIDSDYRVDLRGNTLSGNEYFAGASTTGFSMDINSGFYFEANIVEGCIGGVAVRNWGKEHPWNRCNVFWNNEAGHFGNYIPHETDQIADPMFCNPGALNFTVHGDSPCADGNTPDCGQIGAWGVGCGVVSVEHNAELMSWGRIKDLYRNEEPGRAEQ
jgi:hypothetical protein